MAEVNSRNSKGKKENKKENNDLLEKRIDDFQESLEFTENQLNDKINDVEEKHNIKITSLENKIKDIDMQYTLFFL